METRSSRSTDRFHEDKECFNINISGQGNENRKIYCNLMLSLSLQVYITLSFKILKVCTLFIFLKQINKKTEGEQNIKVENLNELVRKNKAVILITTLH